MLERVTVTRYVTPLREGGSLPGLVEADNLGTYVLKFRGRATKLSDAHDKLAPLITEAMLAEVTAEVPAEWFGDHGSDGYVDHLLRRAPLVPEVIRA